MSETQCRTEVWTQDRWPRQYRCPRKGSVERDGTWYCGTHDPEKVRARRDARQAKYDAHFREQEAIKDEAGRLAQRLGVKGSAEFYHLAPGTGAYVRSLVIPFEDVERLLAELGR